MGKERFKSKRREDNDDDRQEYTRNVQEGRHIGEYTYEQASDLSCTLCVTDDDKGGLRGRGSSIEWRNSSALRARCQWAQ